MDLGLFDNSLLTNNGGGMGSFGGMGGLGGMGGMPSPDSLSPELQRALSLLEGMDQRLSKLSVPLLKIQYECGYKRCLNGNNSLSDNTFNSSSSSSDPLSCIEKCEQPMAEFAQSCENRMGALVENMTQCLTSAQGSHGSSGSESENNAQVERCIADALSENVIRRMEDEIRRDVEGIQMKYQ